MGWIPGKINVSLLGFNDNFKLLVGVISKFQSERKQSKAAKVLKMLKAVESTEKGHTRGYQGMDGVNDKCDRGTGAIKVWK